MDEGADLGSYIRVSFKCIYDIVVYNNTLIIGGEFCYVRADNGNV